MGLLENATKIAEGQNSTVYLEKNGHYDHPVILKVLKDDFNFYPHTSQILNEDELIRNIQIKGVRSSIDLVDLGNKQILVLDYFDGVTLKQHIKRTKLSFTDKLQIAINIADTLDQIHERNIIHRDLSSNNILVNEQGDINIIDFGLASKVDMKQDVLGISEQLEGTLPYISPEQTGRVNHVVDLRSDLYSFGITLYEMFTGELPFISDDPMEIVHAHLAILPTPLDVVNAEIPKVFSDIVLKLLAKNVEARYQSASGVRNDLAKCLEQVALKVEIKNFDLATDDQSGKLLIPSKLYGRGKEITALLESFDQLGSHKEVTLIAGHPGIGKTSLVYEIHKPIAEKKGNFLHGKHEQFQKDLPYHALAQAISGFVNLILSESEERLQKWKAIIQKAVGNEGKLLTDLVPNLELVIGKQPELASLGINEMQNRFVYTFTKFIQSLATKEHPLVLFIDDLQWADFASLYLIKQLICDDELKYFYFIGAYRDNEMDISHPTALVFNDIEKLQIGVNHINLGALEFSDVELLVADCFGCSITEASDLAELVFSKTAGNPFFINQFIQTIYQEDHISFDHSKKIWKWDVEQLTQLNFTDNVVEFMISKIQGLSEHCREILTLASCIGDKFDLKTLSVISEVESNQLHDTLWQLVKDQFLFVKENRPDANPGKIKIDNISINYQFSHDRIRQAAYALIAESEKQALHTKIGKLLLENIDEENRLEYVFDIVYQLNKGSSEDLNTEEKLLLAKLNYEAGNKAKLSSAYDTALSYLQNAEQFSPDNLWKSEYSFKFNLNLALMECAYLLSNYDLMNQIGNNLLKHATSELDQMKVKNIIIFSLIAQNKHIDLIEYGLKVLRSVGIKLPKNPNDLHILQALIKTKALLRNKSISYFQDLPMISDEKIELAVNIMASVSTGSYHNLPKLFPLVIFKSMQLALKHGNMVDTISFYGGYGSILCGVTGEYQLGYDFGKLSLQLLDEKENTKHIKPRTKVIFGAFINHWKDHLKAAIPYLQDSYLVAMETGDTQYAASAIFLESYTRVHVGENLDELLPQLMAYNIKMKQLNQEAYELYLKIFLQGVANIRNEETQSSNLVGEFFDENAFLDDIENELNKDKTALFHIHFNKLFLNYHWEKYDEALTHSEKLVKLSEVVLSTYYIPLFHFYDSLTRIKLAQEAEAKHAKKLLKPVGKNLKKLKKWSEHAPMNYLHKYELVKAELSSLKGDKEEAVGSYDSSIKHADEYGYTNELALAYELKAAHLSRKSADKEETENLKNAYLNYRKWGAHGKTSLLEAKYPYLLNENAFDPLVTYSRSFSSRSLGNKLLDLTTILKAASTISSEIQLVKVIPRLLKIVIENAGAQNGVFILNQNDQPLVHAVGDIDGDVKMIPSISIEDYTEMASSVVHYVARTKEHVVLDDAKENKKFATDDYIKANQIESLLCLPIIYQGELLGMIYLENKLIKGAFTVQRLDLLSMLSGQIAITLNNSLLYDNLEHKVIERTAQIEQQKEQLNLQNEELKTINDEKDYLVSLVSHDLRTPLYGIRSFAGLAERKLTDENTKEYTGPIVETIDRLDKMITRILDISAINAQKVNLNPETIELNELLTSVAETHKEIAGKKEITVELDLPKKKTRLELDKNYLIQVLDNLVSNAIKYSSENKLVTISLKSNLKHVRMGVTDQGPGISKRDQRLLFNNFQKLSAQPTAGEKSTGLGLSIVKKYVESMSGKVWCESELEKGSTFYIEFPKPSA